MKLVYNIIMEKEREYFLCGSCGKEMLDEFCHDCAFIDDNDDLEPNNEYCFEELLISEVHRRRELWDITCDVKLRGPSAQAKAWVAIAEALNIEPERAKKRWKTLRDSYTRKLAEQKTYVPSGSGTSAVPSEEKWQFFKSLEFLKPMIGYRKTTTNKSLLGTGSRTSSPSISSANENSTSSRTSSPISPANENFSRYSTPACSYQAIPSPTTTETCDKRKKRKLSSSSSVDTGFESNLLEALNRPPPLKDDIDSFCSFLATRLRKLEPRLYNYLSHTFMNELIKTELQQQEEYDEEYY